MSAEIMALPARKRQKPPPSEDRPPLGRVLLHEIIAAYGLAQTKKWLEQEIEALG